MLLHKQKSNDESSLRCGRNIFSTVISSMEVQILHLPLQLIAANRISENKWNWKT